MAFYIMKTSDSSSEKESVPIDGSIRKSNYLNLPLFFGGGGGGGGSGYLTWLVVSFAEMLW